MNPSPTSNFAPLEDVEPLISILSKISFFGGVSDAQRHRIFNLLEIGHFNQGEFISKKGDQPSHIYIIKKGRVGLLITDNEVAIQKREFRVGDCFGEAALLSMNNNTASFVALEASEIVVLSQRSLNRLRHEDLELFCLLIMNIARELARKLQFTDNILLANEHSHDQKAA
ncbi:MAG: cyclic nucleotide-binding domain-containing protein [Verrucomicrobiota bacterium]